MGKGAVNLSCLMISSQGTFGTMVTPLVAGDVIETIGQAKISLNPNMTEMPLVGGAFDQNAQVPGFFDQDLSFQVPCRSGGASTEGQFGKLLKLCGMTVADSPSGTYTYTFTSAQASLKDATVWAYGGNLDASGTIREVGFNAMFAPKWTIEGGKFAVMDLSTKMCFAPWATATSPAITKARTIPSAFVGASTLSIMGDTDYKVISASIDPQMEIKLTKDPSQTYGYGVSVVTGRKINWTAKVYRDVLTIVDPSAALAGKTLAAVTIEYGTVPQKIKFDSQYAQITKIEKDDEEGVETWTLSGIFERNDFRIVVTTA